MLSFFKKETKTLCDYSYEYSFITYGDSTEINKQQPGTNDSGNVDSFCYFSFNKEKYFLVGDHSGRIILFNYMTGVEIKSVVMKSRATGMLRVKKFLLFLRELIEEKQSNIERILKEKLSYGIVSFKGKGGMTSESPIIKDNTIIDNYDASDKNKEEQGEEENKEENKIKKEIEEIKHIFTEIQSSIKNVNNENEKEVLELSEKYICELKEKYQIDCENGMVSKGAIGDIQFFNGIIVIAFKKEIYRISLSDFIQLKDNELLIEEGTLTSHDGIIKKIYILNDIIITIANDKKIAFWNTTSNTPLYIMERESDDYYKTSLLTEDGILFISRTNDIYVYQINSEQPSSSKFIKKLEKEGSSPHIDDVDLIEMTNTNKLITVSCDGIVAVWESSHFNLLQVMGLQVQSTEQKKPLFNINSLLSFPRDNTVTYYFAYGGWIVQMEEKNDQIIDVSPKRIDDAFALPYGRYNVDVTQLINVVGSTILAITAESGTIYVLENVKEKKRDILKFVESRKLNSKITAVHMLDDEDGSFIITTNDGTVLMLKDSMKEMKRRQALFMNEMQGF
ncbi:hypothetical protein ENUP19_0018G0041 [Entamoeba nuttalli]|uniref:WD domain, G-beta repeat-containing protein n=2 Tax=Entamoeba nuttalli TaxID=412467 RepID=K2H8L7_ENTNP|nr:hypothetical protein ENU1_003620 [Entamoeba nuttalli P19]EKE42952.1 hypothetical protein ENU1_003620 [Entamoeba nuttalli P19]|eukprot:XP_008854711.1 hypothetical protein ENU1_003620 [Entamoeba nuttalli P19]